VREGNTAKYLRGHTSMCSQQDGKCEFGFQERIASYNFSLGKQAWGTRKSLATDCSVGPSERTTPSPPFPVGTRGSPEPAASFIK